MMNRVNISPESFLQQALIINIAGEEQYNNPFASTDKFKLNPDL